MESEVKQLHQLRIHRIDRSILIPRIEKRREGGDDSFRGFLEILAFVIDWSSIGFGNAFERSAQSLVLAPFHFGLEGGCSARCETLVEKEKVCGHMITAWFRIRPKGYLFLRWCFHNIGCFRRKGRYFSIAKNQLFDSIGIFNEFRLLCIVVIVVGINQRRFTTTTFTFVSNSKFFCRHTEQRRAQLNTLFKTTSLVVLYRVSQHGHCVQGNIPRRGKCQAHNCRHERVAKLLSNVLEEIHRCFGFVFGLWNAYVYLGLDIQDAIKNNS
mmetsp:Transcript_14863/g.37434  ORF Transcript_14863/g.37434 Transcript_14863/m.37434 type:complete len:269 (-) Transcript_14863:384-1190(-)